jgi:hypothetical protein
MNLCCADGAVTAEGSYAELMKNGAFAQLLEECESEREQAISAAQSQQVDDEDEGELQGEGKEGDDAFCRFL